MRRKISLYIADRQVDLDDQSFILFNYAMEDLSNPTIVKNSFSQQITLKGTANNNAIFGDAFRLDRHVGNDGGQAGADFNPSVKTPFVIYNEMGEILESGYAKLDTITRKRNAVEYKVSLYGGLGSFLYSLSYDVNGNKRTLADLDYLGTGNTDSELDFVINAASVRAAWDTNKEGAIDNIWKVINFAPAYNGVPDGNFDAGKALVTPNLVGIEPEVSDDSKTYHTNSGYALVNLSKEHDEWAVKDLRSYLQRPVFSMRAFWNAITKPENNGGYSVDKSILDDYNKFHFNNLWMTLPMLPSLGTMKQSGNDLSLSFQSVLTTAGTKVGRFTINGSVPSGTMVAATLNVKFRVTTPTTPASTLYRAASKAEGRTTINGKQAVIFAQAVAYGSDNTIVGGSKVKTFYTGGTASRVTSGKDIASKCGYVPLWQDEDETFEKALTEDKFNLAGSFYVFNQELGFSVEAYDVAYYDIIINTYQITTKEYVSGNQTVFSVTGVTGGKSCIPVLYENYDSEIPGESAMAIPGSVQNTISYASTDSLRSGAKVTKQMLLSTANTPADYLLSFCKMFGLYMLYDSATRSITILRRNDLYQDEVIDLTKRIDKSKDIVITPFVFDAKWYDFKLEGVGGAFYDEYLSVQGKEYGIQRVNTGYDFNSDSTNLMESLVFKNACTILARSPYFNIIKNGGVFQPSPFLDKGNTYTLWSDDGSTLDTPISCPPTNASVVYYNEHGHNGYDQEFARKVEFRDAEQKPISGENVLLFWEGNDTYGYFKLTDDLPAMDILNDGVPCWILDPGSANGISIPAFSRYRFDNWKVLQSLDFGLPQELDIPAITYGADKTIYAKKWKRYLEDRYDVNTKVMTCRVNLGGLQVNANLLRKFYWYNNTLWVLNSIKNYSLTTFDSVECEFVQVQDKDNYLNGQSN